MMPAPQTMLILTSGGSHRQSAFLWQPTTLAKIFIGIDVQSLAERSAKALEVPAHGH